MHAHEHESTPRRARAHTEQGAFFGERALLYETRRSATVEALMFTDCVCLSREGLDTCLQEFPEDAERIKVRWRGRMAAGVRACMFLWFAVRRSSTRRTGPTRRWWRSRPMSTS